MAKAKFFKKKRGKAKKRKAYTARLMDSKINTGVEVRMKQIAKKLDAAQYVWYKPKQTVAHSAFGWNAYGSVLRVPYASMLAVNAGTLWDLPLTNFGDKIRNNLDITIGHSDLSDNYVRCKALRNRLEFRHQNPWTTRIKVWMISISAAQLLASIQGTAIPDPKSIPGGGMNGLYAFHQSTAREDVPYKYQILNKAEIILPAAKEIKAALYSGLDGSIEAPSTDPLHLSGTAKVPYENIATGTYPLANTGSNQGYDFTPTTQLALELQAVNNTGLVTASNITHSTTVLSQPTKVYFMNEYFKGDGKQFQVEHNTDLPKKSQIFLCVMGDSPFRMTCVSSSTFRLEGLQDQAQPGNA